MNTPLPARKECQRCLRVLDSVLVSDVTGFCTRCALPVPPLDIDHVSGVRIPGEVPAAAEIGHLRGTLAEIRAFVFEAQGKYRDDPPMLSYALGMVHGMCEKALKKEGF